MQGSSTGVTVKFKSDDDSEVHILLTGMMNNAYCVIEQ